MRSKKGKDKTKAKGEEAGPSSRTFEPDYASMTMADCLDFHTIIVPHDPKNVDAQIKNKFYALTEEDKDVPSPMVLEGEVNGRNDQKDLSERQENEDECSESERVVSINFDRH